MLEKTARLPGEAQLIYGDADFDIVQNGDFVVCAVSGKKIPLHRLLYWSVDLQEAYLSPEQASSRMAPKD